MISFIYLIFGGFLLKTLALIKKILTSACVIFTVLFTFIYTLGVSINYEWLPTLGMLYSLLAFSLVLSAMNKYLFSNSLVLGVRILFHYVVTALAFYLLFVVASGFLKNGGSAVTIMIVFSVIYALFAAVVSIVSCIKPKSSKSCSNSKNNKKKSKKETEYKKMF